jgi:hypothetical protein
MALSTRELAAFVQKVAKLQPQDPPVYGSARAYSGCSTCVPVLGDLAGFSDISWGSVALGAVVGAGALYFVSTKTRLLGAMRKRSKKSRKSRKSRRNRRR